MCNPACLSWLQEAHIAKLQGALDAGGDASLQNAMNLAIESLRSIPPYGHREASAFSHCCRSLIKFQILESPCYVLRHNALRRRVLGTAMSQNCLLLNAC